MRRIKDFVQTQKNHSGYYSRLGASYYQNWEDHIDEPVGEGNTAASGPGPSAFATPVLKPRASRPVLAHPPLQEPHVTAPRKDTQPETLSERTNIQKTADDANKAHLAVSNSREVFGNATNTNDPVNSPKRPKRQATSTKEPDATKGSESKHDEHEQRLAERRERRRAKREIVKPPPPPPSSSSTSGSSVTGEEHPSSLEPAKKKDDAKNRKGRKSKSKIMPGIALMENFSAGNLGKERLTLKPTSFVGLFNKGRSSAHSGKDKATAVSVSSKGAKGKKAKAGPSMTDLLFSEFAFLKPSKSGDDRKKRVPLVSPAKSSRTKQRRQKKRIVVQEESESGQSVSSQNNSVISPSRSHSKARTDPTRKKARKGTAQEPNAAQCDSPKNKTASASKSRPVAPSDSSDASGPSLPSRSNVAHQKQDADVQPPEGLRYLSPPWEVDGSLVGDLVPISEKDAAKTLQTAPKSPSPSVGVSEKVVLVSGKWGLVGSGVAKETRTPQVVEETREATAAKESKSTNGTRSRFFPASHDQDQICSQLVESPSDAVLPPPHQGACQRSPKASSLCAGKPQHIRSKLMLWHDETQQAYFDVLSDSVKTHAQHMYDGPYPTDHRDHPPTTVPHQENYFSEFEHFSVLSRVASPDIDPAEDFIPDEYIIPTVPGFEQGLTYGEEYPMESYFIALSDREGFYPIEQDGLQQPLAKRSTPRLWVPQGLSAEGLGASRYVASSTSVAYNHDDLEYTNFELDDTDRFEEGYYDEENHYEGHYQYALDEGEYDYPDHAHSPDNGHGYSQFDQVPMEDAEDQFSAGRPTMLDDFACLNDSIEYHYANQWASRIPQGQDPRHIPSPNAQNEIEEESEIDANGRSQSAFSSSEKLVSNFKHGRALLLGIQQVHGGGTAEVDAEFARQLWRR
ncbi:hypothetical protein M407DRAFT_227160 [Tulasnella calospora MUT 4182]|uniref:Uncharacterized protein n=1 Tax=Tulasnella calospora MUT 4182 TaxID=1051891 RepID=A0A0C3QXW6_9AGAM|nr:hypothetical protein M407DRAFT_227160 [Tulasnella calospora MUT 4182]